MPDMHAPLKLGANCWNQWSDWPAFLAAQQRIDELGYDSLWTWDHLYPILGSSDGPIFEGYSAIAAVAATTSYASVGLLVGANTFRNPALAAKLATTLDHISGGRAVLGVGAAWFGKEHVAFGMPFGESPGERLRWLGEALPIMRAMLDGSRPSVDGERYRTSEVRNDPPPLQERLPILIGGGGRRVTLRLVAQWADACNLQGTLDNVRDGEAALLRHCEAIGRDEREIERTVGLGVAAIRDSHDEAQRVFEALLDHNGGAKPRIEGSVGTPEDIIERCTPLIEMGYRHLIFSFPAPYDSETMERMATEVRPRLEAQISH